MSQYLRLESHFLLNLNEKHIHEHSGDEQAQPGLDTQLFIASYHVLDDSSLIGIPLKKLSFRQLYGCDIIRITKDGASIFINREIASHFMIIVHQTSSKIKKTLWLCLPANHKVYNNIINLWL